MEPFAESEMADVGGKFWGIGLAYAMLFSFGLSVYQIYAGARYWHDEQCVWENFGIPKCILLAGCWKLALVVGGLIYSFTGAKLREWCVGVSKPPGYWGP